MAMATAKSKVEYLKRYGYKAEDSSTKKKIKRVKKSSHAGNVIPRTKIVDDDIDINAVAPNENDDAELETGEDAPQIAGIVDERPAELQKMEIFASNKWRVLGVDDNGEEEVKLPGSHEHIRHRRDSNSDSSLANHRVRHDSGSDHASRSPPRKIRHDSDASPPRQRLHRDSYESPPRKKTKEESDASPPRQRSRHDSDVSPPRRKVRRDSGTSPPRRIGQQDSDASPPRQKIRRSYDSSPRGKMQQRSRTSPPRNKGRQNRDSDTSPPRRRFQRDSDTSPPRREIKKQCSSSPSTHKVRNNSSSSPPRQRFRQNFDASQRRKVQNDSDTSPPRQPRQNSAFAIRHKTEHDSGASISRRKNEQDHDVSGGRCKVQDDSDSSLSRQDARHKRDGRKSHKGSDTSPPRQRARYDTNNSPPRRKTKRDSDASPPSREMLKERSTARPNEQANQNKRLHAKVASDYFPARRKNSVSDSESSPPRKASSSQTKHLLRKKSGLDSDHSSPREKSSRKDGNRVTHKGDQNNESNSDSSPRKSRESLVLQKKTLDGKKAGLQDSKTLKLENEAARERERRLFEKMDEEVSGKNAKTILRDRSTGLRRNLEEEKRKQMEEDAIKAERDQKYNQWGKGVKQTEMQRSRLEQDLKEISKPLARYEDDEDLDKVLRDQDREGDPMLAFIKKKKPTKIGGKELPKYNGPQPPPNRFGIMPGYRWDGVDRSCGFEKTRFSRLSSKVAAEEEAYKWSVEDM